MLQRQYMAVDPTQPCDWRIGTDQDSSANRQQRRVRVRSDRDRRSSQSSPSPTPQHLGRTPPSPRLARNGAGDTWGVSDTDHCQDLVATYHPSYALNVLVSNLPPCGSSRSNNCLETEKETALSAVPCVQKTAHSNFADSVESTGFCGSANCVNSASRTRLC